MCTRSFTSTRFVFISALESRETAGTSIAGNNVEASANAGEASDDDFKPKGKGKASAFSAFAALGMEEPPVDEDGDEDFGGLMVRKMPVLVLRKLLISITMYWVVGNQGL